jgi:membrane protease YdiL (CAAX protease family)
MGSGVVMCVIIAVVFGGVAPEAMAQAVDTSGVQEKSVGDLVETMQQWKLVFLGISLLLVIALLFAGGLLRPGGYAKAGLRDVDSLPSVVWLFAIFVVFLAASSAPQLIGQIQWIQDQQYDETQMQAINTVGSYLFGVIAGLGMLFVLKRSASAVDDEGNKNSGLGLSFLDLPVGLGCFVLAYPFIELMNMLGVWIYTQTQSAAPNNMAHPTLVKLESDSGNPWVWAIVGAAVIGAPFVEELIYRVFLQGALIKWLKSPWLAIIFGSLIFAGMHRLGGENSVPWHALLPIFAVGLSCGIAYERTKRVGVPIMMHVCFNALNVMLALMINADASQTGV